MLHRRQRLHLGVSLFTTFTNLGLIDHPTSDWFRLKTEDDSFQPTIDMLLNVSIFVWYGAVCPWYSFAHNNVIPVYRLIFMAVLVLLFRRLPIVLAMHKSIHQIEEWRQAFFVGFFGPMGVSAIFYLYTSREFLRQITYQGHERADVERLAEVFNVVVWFMVIASVVRFFPSCGSLHFHPNTAEPQIPAGCPRPLHSPWKSRLSPSSHVIRRNCR